MPLLGILRHLKAHSRILGIFCAGFLMTVCSEICLAQQAAPPPVPQQQGAKIPAQLVPQLPPVVPAVCKLEVKAANDNKETCERPNKWVGIVSALAWPVSVIVLMGILLLSLMLSRAVRSFLGVAVSSVKNIEISGVKLDVDPAAVQKDKQDLKEAVQKLINQADRQYIVFAAPFRLKDLLGSFFKALQQTLRDKGFNESPDGLRVTIHVPDIVFEDFFYQLSDYYPKSDPRKSAGRRLSQRAGIIGRSWRLRKSMGRGIAVTGETQLITDWAMQPDEAVQRGHWRPATLCVMLFDKDSQMPVGLLYIDSTLPNAFGTNEVDPAMPTRPTADAVAGLLEGLDATKQLGEAVSAVMKAALTLTGDPLDLTDNDMRE
jgi:hypothetical protein